MISANQRRTESRTDSTETTLASALLRQISLARATELARAGHVVEAERILLDMTRGSEEATPAAFDLLARISAQQGRMLEAAAYWNKALQLDEGNGAYQAGLNRIGRMQGRPAWLRPALFFSGILAIVLCFVVGTVMLGRYGRALPASSKSATTGLSTGSQGFKEEMEGAKPRETLIELPNIKLAVEGVSQKAESNYSVVTFESGLFTHGTSLKREAETKLATLAQHLQPFTGKIRVQVIGCTDDVSVRKGSLYRDNSSLALSRAVIVIDRLRASGLPGEMFLAGSSAESFAPFPNDSRQSRAKNQTVVLRISNNGQ